MPALSPTMTEGKLLEWKKSVGDKIRAGDVLFEIETDKAVMEYESVEEGFLALILVQNNSSNVEVGKLVCILAFKKEEIEAVKLEFEKNQNSGGILEIKISETKKEEEKTSSSEESLGQKSSSEPINKTKTSAEDERIKASPIAKRLASENNISLEQIGQGSGPLGRIIKNDIINAISENKVQQNSIGEKISSSSEERIPEKIPVSAMRKVIASRLLESKITIPHFYLTVEMIMDNLINFRQKINNGFDFLKQNAKITINDLFIKIVSKALELNPGLNVSWGGDHILQYKTIDISVAVSIEGGLITPIVFNADRLSLSEISKTSKSLIEKAKSGKLKSSEFQGGSITISNMGMMGIDEFKAIINPPQASILAIGGLKKKPVIIDDQIVIKQMTKITLSCDHRAVDGALAASFINMVKFFTENPEMIFS